MGDHGGLGPSGGASGVLQPGDVFFACATAGERFRRDLGAQRQQILADVRGPQREQMFHVLGPRDDRSTDVRELGMDDQNVDLGIPTQFDVVVDGSQWVQPGVHRAGEADRGLDHPDLGGVDAQCAHATPLRAALILQHPADATRHVGRLGVGNGAVVLDERGAIAMPGQCLNDQRGVRDPALWLSHDYLLVVEVEVRHWVVGHRRRSTVSSR